jgi:CheY-like chemotaxis protein
MAHQGKPVTILIAEDDDGHAELVEEQFREAGIHNEIRRFRDGQEILDFLFERGPGPKREHGRAYVLLLDIRMPKVDGVEVLRQVKAEPGLRGLPVLMLTTTDDPREIERCYALGCSCYIAKPVQFVRFVETLKRLGLFLMVVQVPEIDGGM